MRDGASRDLRGRQGCPDVCELWTSAILKGNSICFTHKSLFTGLGEYYHIQYVNKIVKWHFAAPGGAVGSLIKFLE